MTLFLYDLKLSVSGLLLTIQPVTTPITQGMMDDWDDLHYCSMAELGWEI